MTQIPPKVSFSQSRLERLLCDLSVTNERISHEGFVDKLGQMMSFNEAINLSLAHKTIRKVEFEPGEDTSDEIKNQFLESRRNIVQVILKSFLPTNEMTRFRLPALPDDVSTDKIISYEPYIRFYLSLQREIDMRIQTASEGVRASMSGLSPEMAQLAALDAAMMDSFAGHSRKYFSIIPKLLSGRFKALWQAHRKSFELSEQLAAGIGPVEQDALANESDVSTAGAQKASSEMPANKEQSRTNDVEVPDNESTQVEEVLATENLSDQMKKDEKIQVEANSIDANPLQQNMSEPLLDDPTRWMQSGGWLNKFCDEMKELLLAELEARIQPLLGLIEALDEEVEGLND